jgi:hypothetical protein
MRNKKVALCFSGQPRDVTNSYPYIKKNILEPNNITDIFIHVHWRDEWPSVKYLNNTYTKEELNQVSELYNPLVLKIEDDRIYNPAIEEYLSTPGLKYNDFFMSKFRSVRYSCDMSIYKANELKNKYEIENDFEYDVVIRCRLDLVPMKPIVVSELDLTKLHVPNLCFIPLAPEKNKDYKEINDVLAMGSKKNMDKYCNLINNIKAIHDMDSTAIAEKACGLNLEYENVVINNSWEFWDFSIYRNINHRGQNRDFKI